MKRQMKCVRFLLGLLSATILSFSNFVFSSFAAEVTLLWNANDEADLAGYAVYQSTDSSGPPYDWIDDISLNEFTDPDNPEAIVTQLEDGEKYYFVVTAFDKSSNESRVSNEICVRVDDASILDCPTKSSSNSVSNVGGGGGGGAG